MPSLYADKHWISGYVLARDSRVWRVDRNENIQLRHVEVDAPSTAIITVIVVIANVTEALATFTTLAGAKRPFKIIVVCQDPAAYSELSWFPHNYRYMLPQCSIFKPTVTLDICNSMIAGLQQVTTSHFCVLGAYSLAHILAFNCIGMELKLHDYDVLLVKKFKINEAGWVHYDNPTVKPIWRTNYVLYMGGFQGEAQSVEEAEAQLLCRTPDKANQGQLDDVLFYVKD
jgi:hypothetical protein